MEVEQFTAGIVAELAEGIKEVLGERAREARGEARLSGLEQRSRELLNRVGRGLMRNVNRVEVEVQSVFGPVRVLRTRFHCPGCGANVYPMDEHYGWKAHRFTPTAKEWICLVSQSEAYDAGAELLGRVSGIRGTAPVFRDVTQECGKRMLRQHDAAVAELEAGKEPVVEATPSVARWKLVGVDGCRVLKSGEQVGRPRKSEKRRQGQGKRRLELVVEGEKEAFRDRGMEAKLGVIGDLVRRQGEYVIEKKSYVTTFESVEKFKDVLYCEALVRGSRPVGAGACDGGWCPVDLELDCVAV